MHSYTYIHVNGRRGNYTAKMKHTYIHTHTHTYIHTYMDVSVAEWLAWLTSNCGRIGAIGSNPGNGLKPNMWGQKWFNPLCQCVYVYVCIVNLDIQTMNRCSDTSIHTYTYKHIHTNIHTYTHSCMHRCSHTSIHTYIHYIGYHNIFLVLSKWSPTEQQLLRRLTVINSKGPPLLLFYFRVWFPPPPPPPKF